MFGKYMSNRQFVLLCLGLYIFINFATFLWTLVVSDTLLSVVWYVALLIVIVIVFFLLWDIADQFIMAKKTSRGFSHTFDILKLTLMACIIYFGPLLYVSWSIKDRYSLIKQSEIFFSKGRIDDAINLAQEAYDNSAIQNKEVKPFFLMQYLYEKSKISEQKIYNKRYQASVNLAYCIQATGKNLDKAEDLFNKSINISKTYFRNDPEYLLFPLLGCFRIYMVREDNTRSDSCYYLLSNILSDLNRYDVFYKTQSLLLYSVFAEKTGDIDRAVALRREALSLYEDEDSDTEYFASILLKVIPDCLETNELSTAKKYLDQCAEIIKESKNKTIYRDYLFVKARYQELVGDISEAENSLLLALDLIKNTPGTSEVDIIRGEYALASVYFQNHKYNLACDLFEQSLKIASDSKDNKILYQDVLLGSVISDYKSGKIETALMKIERIETDLKKRFDQDFLFLPEDEKENYVAKFEKRITLINSIRTSQGDSLNLCCLCNNILATKSVALESNQFIRAFLAKKDAFILRRKYNELMNRKDELNGMKMSGTESFLYSSQISDSLRVAEMSFLKSISDNEGFEKYKITTLTWLDVKRVLNKGQVAIEFINVPIDLATPDRRRYYALVITHESNYPSLVQLFDESDLVILLKNEGTVEEQINKTYTGSSFERLYNLIWKPLNKYTDGSDKVFVSLSGILHKISFPVLTINEKYDVKILSSLRKLALKTNLAEVSVPNRNATLYGDIDYGLNGTLFPKKTRTIENDEFLSSIIRRSGYDSLPGTRNEIEDIAVILRKSKFQTNKIMKSAATEKSFRSLSQNSPNILHLATHGFYYPSDKIPSLSGFLTQESELDYRLKNPFYRSGLLFAGANRLSSGSQLNDGILTSYDISRLDLSGLDLLVLSACETGLGDIRGGEGVYGLQRAFKLAGVENMVISLWKVPDKETSVLMKLFYEYHIRDHFNKQESLKMAQRVMRERDKFGPYFWGAFEIVE